MKLPAWKIKRFEGFKLYAVTDVEPDSPEILKKINDVCRGGADILQLRSKSLLDKEFLQLGKEVRKIADRWQKLFFVNDRLDLALACGADGVHVGQDDLPVTKIREILKSMNRFLWIGLSTHSLNQAKQAKLEKPDYIGVGPIFETPTKPDYGCVGLELIRKVQKEINLPFVCIGGISEKNLPDVLAEGATRIAMVRGLFNQRDIYETSQRIRKQLR